jgi:dienelactone hydrolase
MRHRRNIVVISAISGLLIAACSSNSSTSSDASSAPSATDAATTSTLSAADIAEAAKAYTEPGPYAVGVTTVALANGVPTEIWYPAAAGSVGTETYDARDFTDPVIRALLTAQIPATHSYQAARDAAVADGKFPVVLNSHGFSSWRVASSFLTSHLASWGMIVVSPEHKTRDLLHLASNLPAASATTTTVNGSNDSTPATDATSSTDPKVVAALNESVADLLGGLDFITSQGTDTASKFNGHVDLDHVGALGHSAGGGTIVKAALDPRIDGYVSMASGIFGAATDLPNKPSFFLSGAIDQIAATERTHDAYLKVPTPSLFWRIDGAGHNAFDDICTLGEGKGIIGIAEASGLGAFLDSSPLIRKLGSDGCLPPAVPVTTTFPIIDHAVTEWFLNLFGIDATPKGLDAQVANSYATKLTIEQR